MAAKVEVFIDYSNPDFYLRYGAKVGNKVVIPPTYYSIQYFTDQRNLAVFVVSRKRVFFHKMTEEHVGEFAIFSLKGKILLDFGAPEINKSIQSETVNALAFDLKGFANWAKKQPNVRSERIDAAMRIAAWQADLKNIKKN